jgi:uncharacterized membrane protein YdbT with pleckstrin-like domain
LFLKFVIFTEESSAGFLFILLLIFIYSISDDFTNHKMKELTMEHSLVPDKKYFTKSIWILLTISLFTIIVLFIIHSIVKLTDGSPDAIILIWSIGILAILVTWLFSLPIIYLWIKNLSYTIRDDRVTIHKGILTKTQQNIPFRAITDFALQRSIYDRVLGIGSIKIQTAGQTTHPSGYEGSLSGLLEYEDLHTELRNKIEVLHPTSESLTTREPGKRSSDHVLELILTELKDIKKMIEKR